MVVLVATAKLLFIRGKEIKMLRHALVNKETNIVENLVLWDGETPWTPLDKHLVINIEDKPYVDMGHTYNNGVFIAPPEPERIVVEATPTLAQLQAQLISLTQQMAALANTANT